MDINQYWKFMRNKNTKKFQKACEELGTREAKEFIVDIVSYLEELPNYKRNSKNYQFFQNMREMQSEKMINQGLGITCDVVSSLVLPYLIDINIQNGFNPEVLLLSGIMGSAMVGICSYMAYKSIKSHKDLINYVYNKLNCLHRSDNSYILNRELSNESAKECVEQALKLYDFGECERQI